MRVWLTAWCLVLFVSGCMHQPPPETAARQFRYEADTFAFANETVWKYENGRHLPRARSNNTDGDRYTHHCFVMVRAAVQFWKFARFDPKSPAPTTEELADLIRQVMNERAWKPALPGTKRIVIPGFENLHELSQKHPDTVRAHIGESWPTYLRPGNFFLLVPTASGYREWTHEYIAKSVRQNSPVPLWLYNFPRVNMNHCVVAFDQHHDGGKTVFTIYDPNYTDGPRSLTFDAARCRFLMEKTFYFPGGPVRVRPVFLNRFE